MFAGAAACFYAFVGFDIIATTGEEARTASKSIPKAVAISLVTCYILYIGVSTVLTMMIPFGHMNSSSPLTEAFDRVGIYWAKWLIGVGAVFGLSASLLGSEFPLPRIIYAMACDGLLFRVLSRVNSRTETPVIATLLPGFITAFFAMVFDLRELVEMMSIGTLLAYSLVCTSVLVLRYRPLPEDPLSHTLQGQPISMDLNHEGEVPAIITGCRPRPGICPVFRFCPGIQAPKSGQIISQPNNTWERTKGTNHTN